MPLTFTIYLLFGNGIRINFKQTTMIIDGRNEQGRVQTVDGIRQTALRKKRTHQQIPSILYINISIWRNMKTYWEATMLPRQQEKNNNDNNNNNNRWNNSNEKKWKLFNFNQFKFIRMVFKWSKVISLSVYYHSGLVSSFASLDFFRSYFLSLTFSLLLLHVSFVYYFLITAKPKWSSKRHWK